MKKIALAATVMAVMASGSASAADLGRPIYKAPVMSAVPVSNWSGFYIGGHAGYGWGDSDYDFFAGNAYAPAGSSFSHNMDGFMGGGHLGFNWQMGAFVAGLEGSFTWSDLRRDNITNPLGFVATDVYGTRINWVSTITPRIGFAMNNWLLYVKGGVAFGDIETSIGTVAPVTANTRSDTRVGWTVGAGTEYAFTPNWIIGVEGNYYDFGTLTTNQVSTPVGFLRNDDATVTAWSVLGRLSYKFGPGPIMASY
jgi:outer membrane immunogenic protein